MPPRHPERRSQESKYSHWLSLDEEEPKEEKPETQKPEQKQSEKTPDNKKQKPEKAPRKELSPEEKQERRTDSIERSRALKKQFEETPIPNSSSTVARLIIAEQILTIDERLNNSEALDDTKAKEKLEASLDYMCDLAEKLENPAVESPPHIQEAYEILIGLAEEALDSAESTSELVEEITQMVQSNPDTSRPNTNETDPLTNPSPRTPRSHQRPEQSTPSALENILTYLQAIPERVRNLPPSPVSHTSSQDLHNPTASITGISEGRSMPFHSHSHKEAMATFTEFAHPATHGTREFRGTVQPSISRPLAALALVGTAAAIHNKPDISHRHEAHNPSSSYNSEKSPAAITTHIHTERASISAVHEQPAHAFSLSPAERSTQPNSSTAEIPATNRKLEHMSLPALLSLANNVPVGHGRYLKEEFERGRIDKDGLIKVLKSKKKGLDFSREFSTQAANFRERLASIERITKPPESTISHDASDYESPSRTTDPQLAEPFSEKEPSGHPIFKFYTNPRKSTFPATRNQATSTNLIIAIAVIIGLGTVLLFLTLPVLL